MTTQRLLKNIVAKGRRKNNKTKCIRQWQVQRMEENLGPTERDVNKISGNKILEC